MKKTWPYLILAVLIILAGYWWFNRGPQTNQPTANPNTNNNVLETLPPVVLEFDFSDSEQVVVQYPYNNVSLFAITQTAAKDKNWEFTFKDYKDMGILIDKIRDKSNGDGQMYWQYFVGQEQPQVSVDKYFPKAGETIDWKFQASQF